MARNGGTRQHTHQYHRRNNHLAKFHKLLLFETHRAIHFRSPRLLPLFLNYDLAPDPVLCKTHLRDRLGRLAQMKFKRERGNYVNRLTIHPHWLTAPLLDRRNRRVRQNRIAFHNFLYLNASILC